MNCPNCQSVCGETDRFCFYCGAALQQAPKPKKRTHGAHWVPILILTVLSIVGIALFFLMPMAPAVSETPWFTIEDGALYFDQSLYAGSSELTVPDAVDGQKVTKIADGCFRNCVSLTTVILPDSVTAIGSGAFSGCSALRGIYLPEGITAIGARAFGSCVSLEAICIPSSVTTIGTDAFDSCTKLEHIFYSGTFTRWRGLYSSHINLHTHVYCTDGTYLHR